MKNPPLRGEKLKPCPLGQGREPGPSGLGGGTGEPCPTGQGGWGTLSFGMGEGGDPCLSGQGGWETLPSGAGGDGAGPNGGTSQRWSPPLAGVEGRKTRG